MSAFFFSMARIWLRWASKIRGLRLQRWRREPIVPGETRNRRANAGS